MSLNGWITVRTYSGEQSSNCDIGRGLPLRQHQHHDRPPQPHRVFGRAADPL
jgi:hypothetical protein